MNTAKPEDWWIEKLPLKRTVIPLDRTFSSWEMSAIRRGVVPREMEEKWFIYWKNEKLFFHRSWTGFCIYVVHFVADGDDYKMIKADVNRDQKQYKETNDQKDVELISYLIDVLLLHREAVFPCDDPSSAISALMNWCCAGKAMSKQSHDTLTSYLRDVKKMNRLKTQFTSPIVVEVNGGSRQLARMKLSTDNNCCYNEKWLRDLLYEHPECLPIDEIDRAFMPLIPVCKELHNSAGYIDAIFITPHGRLVVLETKLWRNPESRRKVIGQILDYAQALKKWDYADLQRQVSQATGRKGNYLYQLLLSSGESVPDEAAFVDAVTQNLKDGKFLLLIAGDGIRSQTHSIAEFLMETGTMLFSLAMIEVAIYEDAEAGQLYVQPRILAKTSIIERIVAISQNMDVEDDASTGESEDYNYSKCHDFWQKLLNELVLDDPEQVMPKAPHVHNMKFRFPWTKEAWLTAYIADKGNAVGVMLRAKGDLGDSLYEEFIDNKENIGDVLGMSVSLKKDADNLTIGINKKIDSNIFTPEGQREAVKYFQNAINRFVNLFRPAIASFAM